MEKIDVYINSLYKHMDQGSDDVQVLKEEMKNHLLQTVDELKAEGKSEEQSIEIAISRFGEGRQIEQELTKVFKLQKKFAKALLRASLVFLAAALVAFLSYQALFYNYHVINAKLLDEYAQCVENGINNNNTIPKEEISNLFEKYNKRMRFFAVVNLTLNPDSRRHPSSEAINNGGYIYPADIPIRELNSEMNGKSFDAGNTKWEVWCGLKGNVYTIPGLVAANIISVICFVIYWVLFGIWGTINAYHANRFSISWVILFFTLNIGGLIIFKLDELQWFKKLIPHKA